MCTGVDSLLVQLFVIAVASLSVSKKENCCDYYCNGWNHCKYVVVWGLALCEEYTVLLVCFCYIPDYT